ncbi:MAG: AMP-binding protein [Pseudomonadota bacterium]|nr:AMP-binding protein [Pseudomonadota bacterium]
MRPVDVPPVAVPEAGVPEAVSCRTPLATAAGAALLRRLQEHADAPPWSHTLGDRLHAEDVPALDTFRRTLGPVLADPAALPLARWRETVPWVRTRAPDTVAWADIPLQGRADIAYRLVDLVPLDADLRRLFHYETSGTTGHPLSIPSHARATAMNHLLVEEALARIGVRLDHGPSVLVAHVCAQVRTWTFPAILSYWGGGALVKVNLQPAEWARDRARRFLVDLDAQLLTGDPVSFAELLAWDIPLRPRALLSGAATLAPALAEALTARFGCPVVDVYSTTEIGPIAASGPGGLRLLCPDLYVEVVGPDGRPLPDGERGEIVVSGGRNPYLPLLRYATGDHARKEGEYLRDLQARRPVSWRATDGAVITPVDLARALHPHVFAAFAFREEADGFVLRVRPVEGEPLDGAALGAGLAAILGQPVAVHLDAALGRDGKAAEWTGRGD